MVTEQAISTPTKTTTVKSPSGYYYTIRTYSRILGKIVVEAWNSDENGAPKYHLPISRHSFEDTQWTTTPSEDRADEMHEQLAEAYRTGERW